MNTSALIALFDRVPELVNADQDLVRRGAWCRARFAVFLGDIPFYLAIDHGRVAEFDRGPALMRSWQFAVKGSPEGWRDHWRAVPAPDSYDLFALMKRGAATIEGDLHPFFAHLQYLKDLLAKPRHLSQGR